jgi:hypothetical protein
MTDDEMQSARLALGQMIGELAAQMPPLSPEDEVWIQRVLRRDELVRERYRARMAGDREGLIAAVEALIAFDEENTGRESDSYYEEGTADAK